MINRKLGKCPFNSNVLSSTRNTSDWLGKPRHSYSVSGLADKLDIKKTLTSCPLYKQNYIGLVLEEKAASEY